MQHSRPCLSESQCQSEDVPNGRDRSPRLDHGQGAKGVLANARQQRAERDHLHVDSRGFEAVSQRAIPAKNDQWLPRISIEVFDQIRQGDLAAAQHCSMVDEDNSPWGAQLRSPVLRLTVRTMTAGVFNRILRSSPMLHCRMY